MFSTASALFLFPSMYPYYLKALEVYRFERADGTGKAYDLVIQGFVRFNFLAVLPVIFAVSVIYLLVSNILALNYTFHVSSHTSSPPPPPPSISSAFPVSLSSTP